MELRGWARRFNLHARGAQTKRKLINIYNLRAFSSKFKEKIADILLVGLKVKLRRILRPSPNNYSTFNKHILHIFTRLTRI